jgi:hypothetical protein
MTQSTAGLPREAHERRPVNPAIRSGIQRSTLAWYAA